MMMVGWLSMKLTRGPEYEHDGQVLHHAHRGDDGIYGEDGVQDDNLGDDLPEDSMMLGVLVRIEDLSLQAFVHFHGALEEQEYAAYDEDDVAPGEVMPHQGHDGLGQGDHPGYAGKQRQAGDQGKAQAQHKGMAALGGGQGGGEDGDEDDIVDTKDDFNKNKRTQAGPG